MSRECVEQSLVKRIVEAGIATGSISLNGLSEDQQSDAICNYLKSLDATHEFAFQIDHRPDLLKRARQATKKEEFEFAALMFAIWAEHWVNGLIDTYAKRKKLTSEYTVEIIRETPLRGKLTWLSVLLDIPPISRQHRNAILTIVGFRNCFAHYKWKSFPVDSDRFPLELINAVNEFGKTVKYLHRYESRHVYGDSRRLATSGGNHTDPT
jgi:hypothetical protein